MTFRRDFLKVGMPEGVCFPGEKGTKKSDSTESRGLCHTKEKEMKNNKPGSSQEPDNALLQGVERGAGFSQCYIFSQESRPHMECGQAQINGTCIVPLSFALSPVYM